MQNDMEPQKNILTVPVSIIVAGTIIGGALLLKDGPPARPPLSQTKRVEVAAQSTELTLRLGDLGAKLVSVGVVDREKFLSLYPNTNSPRRIGVGVNAGAQRDEAVRLIEGGEELSVRITPENAGVVLNLLWALGLGNKSAVLEKGEMTNAVYGGADRFASTAGWTIAKDSPMQHYSRHLFIKLTPEQERLVEKVSQGIYRPCCDNSTHFPDCNHGMAMLGLLELLASQGASETELYDAALAANRLWFPDQYTVIGEYEAFLRGKGKTLSAQDLVGRSVASASGFQRIAAERAQWGVAPSQEEQRGGGGCSV